MRKSPDNFMKGWDTQVKHVRFKNRHGWPNWVLLGAVLLSVLSLPALAAPNVIAWGDNTSSQLNIPASATNVVMVAAGAFHNLALRSNGTVVA